MSRSSSRHHASKVNEQARVPAWVWLFTGAILGAFIMFLMRLSEISPQEVQNTATTSSADQREADTEKSAQKPRFDFYELLKESKVKIQADPDKQERTDAKPSAPQEFLLQVASFKSIDDAERLRAQLILLNLDAYTEHAKIRNGQTWHRVIVGPFTSKSKLSKARNTLLSNKYEALVLKRRPAA